MVQPSEALALVALVTVALFAAKLFRPDPLKSFPGPSLAKWTWLYRAYYDIVADGEWLHHLRDLHEKYGTAVRVGSNELHFTEPAAYHDIYNSPYKMSKEPVMYRDAFEFGLPSNVFSVVNPKEHSEIKSLFSSYFSRKCVLKLEHVIQERVDTFISQMLKNHSASPAYMNHAFRSITLDVITLYTLRTHVDATSYPSFRHPAILSVDDTMVTTWIFRHMAGLGHLVAKLPDWLAILISSSAKPRIEMQREIEMLVDNALMEGKEDDPEGEDLNVFHTLVSNARVAGKLKQSHRVKKDWLVSEGTTLRIAGSDTVGNACTIGTRCLVRDDRVRAKLVQELDTAWPDKGNALPLERLEKLPYLTAVIKESLRLSYGVVTPMPRVVPESGAIIAGHAVPAGTIVSIANSFVHMNPDIFPDPARFYPERWLEDKDHTLDRFLVSFGKGPRSCLGINLAWCELYLILGNVFRKLAFKSDSDLCSEVQFREYFVPTYVGDVLSATVTERE
ncbi:hypothetical protein VNI00_011081 [Paramarasmius palmivorus]|uniref:Cytochrome P450 n=1 Tax=Paramarasmius palmivorus TaxID=297713 RepID=A0AAW0CFQ8_9AGAR